MTILPVTVNGSRKVLPKGSIIFNPGPIEVVVGDPIETSEYTSDGFDDLVQKTRNVIVSNFK
jgi:1-acyl-sn-glycerol-3-phosphate acyltransferase